MKTAKITQILDAQNNNISPEVGIDSVFYEEELSQNTIVRQPFAQHVVLYKSDEASQQEVNNSASEFSVVKIKDSSLGNSSYKMIEIQQHKLSSNIAEVEQVKNVDRRVDNQDVSIRSLQNSIRNLSKIQPDEPFDLKLSENSDSSIKNNIKVDKYDSVSSSNTYAYKEEQLLHPTEESLNPSQGPTAAPSLDPTLTTCVLVSEMQAYGTDETQQQVIAEKSRWVPYVQLKNLVADYELNRINYNIAKAKEADTSAARTIRRNYTTLNSKNNQQDASLIALINRANIVDASVTNALHIPATTLYFSPDDKKKYAFLVASFNGANDPDNPSSVDDYRGRYSWLTRDVVASILPTAGTEEVDLSGLTQLINHVNNQTDPSVSALEKKVSDLDHGFISVEDVQKKGVVNKVDLGLTSTKDSYNKYLDAVNLTLGNGRGNSQKISLSPCLADSSLHSSLGKITLKVDSSSAFDSLSNSLPTPKVKVQLKLSNSSTYDEDYNSSNLGLNGVRGNKIEWNEYGTVVDGGLIKVQKTYGRPADSSLTIESDQIRIGTTVFNENFSYNDRKIIKNRWLKVIPMTSTSIRWNFRNVNGNQVLVNGNVDNRIQAPAPLSSTKLVQNITDGQFGNGGYKTVTDNYFTYSWQDVYAIEFRKMNGKVIDDKFRSISTYDKRFWNFASIKDFLYNNNRNNLDSSLLNGLYVAANKFYVFNYDQALNTNRYADIKCEIINNGKTSRFFSNPSSTHTFYTYLYNFSNGIIQGQPLRIFFTIGDTDNFSGFSPIPNSDYESGYYINRYIDNNNQIFDIIDF